jgi:hypothetical protein
MISREKTVRFGFTASITLRRILHRGVEEFFRKVPWIRPVPELGVVRSGNVDAAPRCHGVGKSQPLRHVGDDFFSRLAGSGSSMFDPGADLRDDDILFLEGVL